MSDTEQRKTARAGGASPSRTGQHASYSNHQDHLGNVADKLIARLHDVDGKVAEMRTTAQNDEETLFDKVLKVALPGIAGIAAGRVFKLLWNRSLTKFAGKKGEPVDTEDSVFLSVLFAALLAAITAIVSQLSDRGSKALVAHRHSGSSGRPAKR